LRIARHLPQFSSLLFGDLHQQLECRLFDVLRTGTTHRTRACVQIGRSCSTVVA
jgi:hypothetical protein